MNTKADAGREQAISSEEVCAQLRDHLLAAERRIDSLTLQFSAERRRSDDLRIQVRACVLELAGLYNDLAARS